MNFTQVFVLGFSPGTGSTLGDFKARTVGQFSAGAGMTWEFKGRGRGVGGCAEGVCSGSFAIKANTAGGRRIVFDLNIIIDTTAAGVVLEGNALLR